MTVHALTIDLEDWHQLFHRRLTGEVIRPTPTVVATTHRLLDMLDDAGTRATFFVLGNVADTYPELVREVVRRGHEIGSHTYSHELIFRMEPAAFRADMERSLAQLQDLASQPILGFRAPEFSVGHLQHWCFEILAELGFRYDSSVFPVQGARYGIPEAPRYPFAIATPSGTLYEYPLATWDVGRFRLPVAGGSYFRLLPSGLLRRALNDIDASKRTAVLYFHPYEFHPGWLNPSWLAWRNSLRASNLKFTLSRILLHNFRTDLIGQRLKLLLAQFKFVPLGDIYRATREGSIDDGG
ncbi:MAG TPA: polysaccharide deacetylase family protein [Rubrobacteraceae bacterium]|jgi:polysaccharide deacetylase family protein (PEP-CTERM system associated)|nr:polysaccharide deacetylase family protein [Rubrobacteraceae bacterium]